ncbi:hypothetical protein DFH09DRAFT_1221228 [Mycena vulgaris]|nr:hypothetical protein DFH09DRAFT_1221228 [Mycena vulgaris]
MAPDGDAHPPRTYEPFSESIHGHILSDKSAELHRDTFFFAPAGPHPIRLVLGLNQTLTPVTSATLRRWAHLMAGRPQEFYLCPVKLTPRGIMSYSMSPSGDILDPDSNQPLPPGNYGWYRDRGLTAGGFTDLTGVDRAMRNKSFEHNVTFMEGEQLWALYKFPSDIETVIFERDAQRCRVTDATVGIMEMWIVPPPWGWAATNSYDPLDMVTRRCDADLHPLGIDPTPFLVAANAILLRKDLKVHFYNHNFAVDADDNYRVVILRDMGGAQKLLPTHLPRHPNHDPQDATFFRLHFRYSMNFMLLGGDIIEKYPPHIILREMDLLGVGHDSEREMAPLSDERWQTDLGKAILADIIRAKTVLSQYYSDHSDSDPSESGSDRPSIMSLPGPEWSEPDDTLSEDARWEKIDDGAFEGLGWAVPDEGPLKGSGWAAPDDLTFKITGLDAPTAVPFTSAAWEEPGSDDMLWSVSEKPEPPDVTSSMDSLTLY